MKKEQLEVLNSVADMLRNIIPPLAVAANCDLAKLSKLLSAAAENPTIEPVSTVLLSDLSNGLANLALQSDPEQTLLRLGKSSKPTNH